MTVSAITVVTVLWAGILAFASPCFLPIVPVFVGYLTGQPGSTKTSRWFGVTQSFAFMAAFSFVFITLWALIGMIGHVVGSFHSLLRIAGGVILVVLGLHTAGVIHLPFLDKVVRINYRPDGTKPPSMRRSMLLGVAFSAGWTPCIGPILGAVLALTTVTSSMLQGVALMVVFCLGLGLPLVLISAGVGSLVDRLSWFVKHQRAVHWVIGAFLIVVGFLMILDLFSKLSTWAPI